MTATVADVDQFDCGQEQWDLVAGMYMHETITRNAQKIAASLNELLRAFDQLRIVYYEEAQASPYWNTSAAPAPIVRFAAVRNLSR